MNPEAERFLKELENALDHDSAREEIMAEYEMHVKEMLTDLEGTQDKVYEFLVDRLGSPEELADLWKNEKSVTPKNMQRLLCFLTSLYLLVGLYLPSRTIFWNGNGWMCSGGH